MRRWFLCLILLSSGFSIFGQGNLVFKENKGQWDEEVRYAASADGRTIFLTDEGVTFKILEVPDRHGHDYKSYPSILKGHAFKLNFKVNNSKSLFYPRNEVETKCNYLKGPQDDWASSVKGYKNVWWQISSGLSIEFYSNGNQLKYDIHADSKHDLDKLTVEYDGVEVSEKFGNLHFTTSLGEFTESIPLAYKKSNNENLPCSYNLQGNQVRYLIEEEIGEFEAVVIDPILVFSTYSGSTADNWGSTATFDNEGNLFAGGISIERLSNESFPTTTGAFQVENNGDWDVAITKYDSVGATQVYSTLLGGSSAEMVQSLVVNSKNELVVMGVTSSANFPVSANAFQENFAGGTISSPFQSQFNDGGVVLTNGTDIFVTVLSEDGSQLIGSTFL